MHAPFWMGAAAVVAGRRTLGTHHDVPQDRARRDEAELLAVADLD